MKRTNVAARSCFVASFNASLRAPWVVGAWASVRTDIRAISRASTVVPPIAPKTPLPDRPDYHRLFHYNAIMVGNLLLDMGVRYDRPDGRVWFVEDLAP